MHGILASPVERPSPGLPRGLKHYDWPPNSASMCRLQKKKGFAQQRLTPRLKACRLSYPVQVAMRNVLFRAATAISLMQATSPLCAAIFTPYCPLEAAPEPRWEQ